MKHALLGHIVCPSDKHPLALEVQKADNSEIMNGTLTCKNGDTCRKMARLPLTSTRKKVPSANFVMTFSETTIRSHRRMNV